jgi:ferredoxin
MNYGLLKKARVIISLVFFLFIGFFFLDLHQLLGSGWINSFLYLQFIPSFLSFIKGIGLGTAGFVFIILLTLLFGRIYCSTLCPLGVFQDIISRISSKFRRKKLRYKYHKPSSILRYTLLALTLVVLFTGSLFMVTWLDPYSIFGRIFTNLFKPVYLGLNNLLATVLEEMGIYDVFKIEWKGISWVAFGSALAFLGLVGTLSWKRGRLYCNAVCPLGTFLGLLAKWSLFKINLDRFACTSCGKCSVVCKSECINVKTQEVDFSRCVGCLNCLTPCPDNGVNFEFAWKPDKGKTNTDKRILLKGLSLLPLISALPKGSIAQGGRQRGRNRKEPVPIDRKNHATPPGSLSREHFNESCTACGLCVSVCPTQVIRPSTTEYGVWWMMQPFMDYNSNFCNYECTACTEICPTGALNPLPLEEKKLVQLGKAKFIKRNCIVHTDGTDCGACSEHCPTKAVDMVPYRGNLTIPKVDETICIGCGACEYACPTDPLSIYVEGNREHVMADEPVREELDKDIDYKEDFPF